MNNLDMITAEADATGFCIVCGKANDECPKHGPADRAATKLMEAHDRGDHTHCNAKGCPLAGTVTGRAAPSWTPTPVRPSGDVPAWAKRVTAADVRGKALATHPHAETVASENPDKPETALAWEEPEAGGRFTWVATVAELKANPGRWAKVIVAPNRTHANRARNALRYHGAATRTKKTNPNGEVTVWASWNPKENA